MKTVAILLVTALLLSLTACATVVAPEGTLTYPWGKYKYKAIDHDGNEIAAGRFHIAPLTEATHDLVGRWECDTMKGSDGAAKNGDLAGTRRGDGLAISFRNPADNMVVNMAGHLEGDKLQGDWFATTPDGKPMQGTFTAFRVEAPELRDRRDRSVSEFLELPVPRPKMASSSEN